MLSTTMASKNKTSEDLVQANKGVWDRWWTGKIKANQRMLRYVRESRYEDVAKTIDTNFNDD